LPHNNIDDRYDDSYKYDKFKILVSYNKQAMTYVAYNSTTGKEIATSKTMINVLTGFGLVYYKSGNVNVYVNEIGHKFDISEDFHVVSRRNDNLILQGSECQYLYNIYTNKMKALAISGGNFINSFLVVENSEYTTNKPCFIKCAITGKTIFEYRKPTTLLWQGEFLMTKVQETYKIYKLQREVLHVDECFVCLEEIAKKTHAFTPCGHSLICEKCAGKTYAKCPICQNQATLIKLFFPHS
jgi:hypothetical protein